MFFWAAIKESKRLRVLRRRFNDAQSRVGGTAAKVVMRDKTRKLCFSEIIRVFKKEPTPPTCNKWKICYTKKEWKIEKKNLFPLPPKDRNLESFCCCLLRRPRSKILFYEQHVRSRLNGKVFHSETISLAGREKAFAKDYDKVSCRAGGGKSRQNLSIY